LNLTAADHVFILDPWWNPAAQDQAADRAHRIGQGNTVMIHPLVALDSVEEKIMELQNAKRSLAAAAFGEGTAGVVSREDILDLLR
jgi:SNF2 family DNA or RNA helicase